MKRTLIFNLFCSLLFSSCIIWTETDYTLKNESSSTVSVIDTESSDKKVYTLASGQSVTISHATNAQFMLTEETEQSAHVFVKNGYDCSTIVDLQGYTFEANNLTSTQIQVTIQNYKFENIFTISPATNASNPGKLPENSIIYTMKPELVFNPKVITYKLETIGNKVILTIDAVPQ